MVIRDLSCILILIGSTGFGARAVAEVKATETGLQKAIWLLEQTPSGKQEIEQARHLKIPIQEGQISKTEITATRTQSGNENEKYRFQVQVLIAKDKDPVFQALDLAHELTHAIHPKENPFDPKLDPTQYVKNGIEGKGGEAPAIAQECQVGKELVSLSGSVVKEETVQLIKARCNFVWKTQADVSKWNQSFYYLGQYSRDFISLLKKTNANTEQKIAWVNQIEEKSPMFASAVAHKPYPLALLEEYMQITRLVCEKTLNSTVGRKIASLGALQARCRGFDQQD